MDIIPKLPFRTPLLLKKIKRRFLLWIKLTLKDFIAPLVDKTAFLQFLSFPFLLYFISHYNGLNAVTEKVIEVIEVFQSILYSLPLYLTYCAIRSLFLVTKEEKKKGTWFGPEFVYNEPLLVLTARVTNEDNAKPISFLIPEAERGGSVQFRVEVDGTDTNVRTQIKTEDTIGIRIPWELIQYHKITLTWTPKNKKCYLLTMKENINPAIIRVYLLSINLK